MSNPAICQLGENLSDLGHNTDPIDPRNSSIKERKRMGFETWWKMQHILPAANNPTHSRVGLQQRGEQELGAAALGRITPLTTTPEKAPPSCNSTSPARWGGGAGGPEEEEEVTSSRGLVGG